MRHSDEIPLQGGDAPFPLYHVDAVTTLQKLSHARVSLIRLDAPWRAKRLAMGALGLVLDVSGNVGWAG